MASSVDPSARPPVTPRPAAAVVPLRDGPTGLEVLVGQRTPAARFMGGFWVFPGGRVEPSDGEGDAANRAAAARELREEVGLTVAADALVALDRWITPEPLPVRFDTAFFLGRIEGDPPIVIDGEEIVAHRWVAPAQLLEDAVAQGLAVVAFPTRCQLEELAGWATTDEALAACEGRAIEPVTPVVDPRDGDPILRIRRAGIERAFPLTDVPAAERPR
ncbi:NUDIX hydrolase [Patulibacter defluvii]|uniref:NUDIX hydrolase n=1 Tax=Patulibacter defluvii TaxID=3095358 RepID=UPI002A74C499|nr:NUDIX domain-containing protein [Patulibacter sp. DM4]